MMGDWARMNGEGTMGTTDDYSGLGFPSNHLELQSEALSADLSKALGKSRLGPESNCTCLLQGPRLFSLVF